MVSLYKCKNCKKSYENEEGLKIVKGMYYCTTCNSDTPKYLILGHARHGKDTLGDIMRDELGIKAISSSEFLAENLMFPLLKDKYGYKNHKECFKDRVNHRKEWFDVISEYNTPDKTKLPRAILDVNDLYIGLRKRDELLPAKEQNLFDLIIWVDACERLPEESIESMDILRSDADIIIENNGTEAEFKDKALRLLGFLRC